MSVETLLLATEEHKVVRIDAADNTLDLAICEGNATGRCPTTSGPSHSWLASIDVPDRPGGGVPMLAVRRPPAR